MKRNEELEERVLETYRKAKDRIQKIHKATAMKEKEERARRAQIISLITFSPKYTFFISNEILINCASLRSIDRH